MVLFVGLDEAVSEVWGASAVFIFEERGGVLGTGLVVAVEG